MSEDLNLSVDCKKVIEWLFERKKIPKDWPKKHKALQLKMSKIAEKDIVQYKHISEYLAEKRETFDYYNLCMVIEKLLQTSEANEKNFFGNFSSPIIKEWVAMREFFQKDNMHIVDIARILSQNVTFEIPALRKNILLLESQHKDNLDKILDLKTTIKTSERDFQSSCEKMNIRGENLEKEVVELILTLPQIFKQFVEKIKKPETKDILKYYYDFVMYINSKQDKEKIVLGILEYLYQEDDDTLTFYTNKQQGLHIESDLIEFNKKRYGQYEELVNSIEKNQASRHPQMEIDWNFDIQTFGQQETVPTVPANPSNEIVWDITFENEVVLPPAEKKEEIAIDLVDNSEFHILENEKKQEHPNEDWEIIDVKATGNNREYEKETLLSNRDTRNEIIANLYEILFFLKQRIFETKSFSTNSLLQAYDHTTTGTLFEVTVEKLEIYHSHVLDLINLITNYKIRNLFIIKEQPKARERIVSNLNQFLLNIEKNKKNIEIYEKKMEELHNILEVSKIKMKKMIDETLELKVFCEKLLKEMIKKEISIVGDINKLK